MKKLEGIKAVKGKMHDCHNCQAVCGQLEALHEQTHRPNHFYRFINIFLVPTPCLTYLKIQALRYRYPNLRPLRNGNVVIGAFTCILSGILNVVMWVRLFPITVMGLAAIFHEASFDAFLSSMTNHLTDYTFRNLWVVVAEIIVSTWALNSFTLTTSFKSVCEECSMIAMSQGIESAGKPYSEGKYNPQGGQPFS